MRFHLPKTFDWILLAIPIILVSAGIVVIYSLTYFNDKIYLVNNQIIYASVSFLIMILLTFLDYRNFKALAWILYIIGLVLLGLVFFVGKSAYGATRWIDLGIFQLQPAEFMKLFVVFALARYFSDKIGQIKAKHIIFGFLLILVPVAMILQQPDFGSLSVVFVVGLAIILFSRLNRAQIITILLIVALAIPASWLVLKDYQKERIYTFLDPYSDQFGSGYNVLQSTITIGSGGLFGKGLGHGPQSQLNFLPVAHTDFVFAGLAEASGFIGSVFIILIFMLLVWRATNVAQISKDSFGMLVAIGIGVMFLFQVFVNIGMNLGIMPVTGIPLPFVSYGGSSLLISFISIGILQSIYLRHKKISF